MVDLMANTYQVMDVSGENVQEEKQDSSQDGDSKNDNSSEGLLQQIPSDTHEMPSNNGQIISGNPEASQDVESTMLEPTTPKTPESQPAAKVDHEEALRVSFQNSSCIPPQAVSQNVSPQAEAQAEAQVEAQN